LLEVKGLTKQYPTPRGPISILNDITLSLSRGDAVSIMGPSGSGKSTLLYILGALEPPSSGTVRLDGRNPFELPEKDLAAFRNKEIGFIFQDHCLLPQCSVIENVLTPTLVAEVDGEETRRRALSLLEQVGPGDALSARPARPAQAARARAAASPRRSLRPRA